MLGAKVRALRGGREEGEGDLELETGDAEVGTEQPEARVLLPRDWGPTSHPLIPWIGRVFPRTTLHLSEIKFITRD